jgi:sec-independent protein translocase protein TatA
MLIDLRPAEANWRTIMGNIGTGELIIALLIVGLLFGAKRLPEVARGLGQSLKIFKTEISRPAADDVIRQTTEPSAGSEPAAR